MPQKKEGDSPLQRPVTQKDVAERAGVSRAVVSYVVNNGPRVVAPETQARVLKAIEELGYRPNKYAQGLKFNESERATGQIGIIMGGSIEIMKRPYFNAVLAGIYSEARRQKQQVRLLTFFDELTDPVFFNKNIHPEEISGLILVAPYLLKQDAQVREMFDRIRERIDNIVSLEVVLDNFPAVIFDRVAAARMAVDHLLDLGHTRVGYAGAPDERVDGYRQALLEHSLPYDPALLQHPGNLNSPEEGYKSAVNFTRLADPPTAIFAASDEVAIGAIGAFQDAGLRVPDDVAIASVDNTFLAPIVRPALTTVHVPKESFGIYALQMLRMRREAPDAYAASLVLPTELIVRQSSGGPRA